jgi:hypothetical protein
MRPDIRNHTALSEGSQRVETQSGQPDKARHRACQREGMIVGQRRPPRLRLAFELLLDPVPRFRVDDRRMKAVVDLPFVPQPSDIDRVREDPIEVTARHQSASGSSACLAHPNRRAKVLGVEDCLEAHHAADFEMAAKEGADELGLLFDNLEGAIFHPVAERNQKAFEA